VIRVHTWFSMPFFLSAPGRACRLILLYIFEFCNINSCGGPYRFYTFQTPALCPNVGFYLSTVEGWTGEVFKNFFQEHARELSIFVLRRKSLLQRGPTGHMHTDRRWKCCYKTGGIQEKHLWIVKVLLHNRRWCFIHDGINRDHQNAWMLKVLNTS
jgi:hypothetical protein